MLAKEVRMKHYILACKIDKFVNETHKIIKAPFCNKKNQVYRNILMQNTMKNIMFMLHELHNALLVVLFFNFCYNIRLEKFFIHIFLLKIEGYICHIISFLNLFLIGTQKNCTKKSPLYLNFDDSI